MVPACALKDPFTTLLHIGAGSCQDYKPPWGELTLACGGTTLHCALQNAPLIAECSQLQAHWHAVSITTNSVCAGVF